jgi:hypothetical protein
MSADGVLEVVFVNFPLCAFQGICSGRARSFELRRTVIFSAETVFRAFHMRFLGPGLPISIRCVATGLPQDTLNDLCAILGKGRRLSFVESVMETEWVMRFSTIRIRSPLLEVNWAVRSGSVQRSAIKFFPEPKLFQLPSQTQVEQLIGEVTRAANQGHVLSEIACLELSKKFPRYSTISDRRKWMISGVRAGNPGMAVRLLNICDAVSKGFYRNCLHFLHLSGATDFPWGMALRSAGSRRLKWLRRGVNLRDHRCGIELVMRLIFQPNPDYETARRIGNNRLRNRKGCEVMSACIDWVEWQREKGNPVIWGIFQGYEMMAEIQSFCVGRREPACLRVQAVKICCKV